MTETKTAPAENGLYVALAKLQANLPNVGKEGEGQYGKYARLEDVSRTIMPLLGKLGLSFIARPTLQDGQLVLAYSLVHTSGEREDGIYPLVSNGTPQQIGSAITYARRYSLCAVTGVAPGGDDDDAQSAQQAAPDALVARQSQRRESFEQARPPEHSADADDGDWGDWRDVIKDIASAEDAEKADADLREVFKAGQMGPAKANAIRAAIKARAASLGNGKAEPGPDMLAQRFGGEATAAGDPAALRKVHQAAMKAGKLQEFISLDNGYAGTLLTYITARKAELEAAGNGQAASQ